MNVLSFTVVVALSGVMSYASPGVFERVAANRAAGLTAHDIADNWSSYDILIATEDCKFVGDTGVVIVDDGRSYSTIVVDCQSQKDRSVASLESLGLVADGTRIDVVHHHVVIVLFHDVLSMNAASAKNNLAIIPRPVTQSARAWYNNRTRRRLPPP